MLALGACSAPPPPPPPVPHGYVEGAEETAETQSRLVVADGGGAVRVLDLLTEEVRELAPVPGVREAATDGRFAYLSDADSVHVVDSGGWTVDHSDHVHHYRAEIRELGEVPLATPAQAQSDKVVVALSGADGQVALLNREPLEKGEIERAGNLRVRPGTAAVPYEQRVLAMSDTGVRVLDRNGAETGRIAEPCAEPTGTAVTRRGVVFGCADGALLVTADDGEFRGEKIPYPSNAPRATEFHMRPGSDTLAALAGTDGAWLLDLSQRSFTHVPTGPVTAVNAVGAGGSLLAVGTDGTLRAYRQDGTEIARNQVVAPGGPPPSIQVDTSRAYVNDVAAGTVHEIDYNDGLRVARSFQLGGQAAHVVETGR
ncbi:hypothetical protein QFW96_16905 [Saccharopolyspora sp. TS4A08]|uniref:ABC transporter n=1 Tax=Saccharopolyspora ipomoeae TaxID=3042027 RepID=A0ABT6PQN7_9PSEU|nr:hypothetical protein [Saccharopolyspora sp. TS4A08]MDI2030312.1 hypothetical protein [Saccharopolyspora sp. TS4A08]